MFSKPRADRKTFRNRHVLFFRPFFVGAGSGASAGFAAVWTRFASRVVPDPIRYDLEAALPECVVFWNPGQVVQSFVSADDADADRLF
jgi:hypothetical protein